MRRTIGFITMIVVLAMVDYGAMAATVVKDLYRAQAILTGQGEKNRSIGFAQCLTDVLVKVSGDPKLLDDPRVATLDAQADTFVRAFRYHDRMEGLPVHDEQGTRDRPYDLIVDFYPEKIDAILCSLGRAPWPASRPRVVMFVAVRNIVTSYMLTDDDRVHGPGQRESLMAASWKLGISVALPSQAALSSAGLDIERLPSTDLANLDVAARSLGGDLALAGSMVFDDDVHGWIADWRLALQDKTYRWHARGVNFDEAFRVAMRGAAQILSGHGTPD